MGHDAPGQGSMSGISKQRRWHRKPIAIAVTVTLAIIAAPALAAFEPLAVFGAPGTGPGTISPHAAAIAVDAQGRVYVADAFDDRIEAFANDGTPNGGWGGLAAPAGVAAAPDGSVVVSDRSGVYRYDAAGSRLATLAQAGGAVGPPAGVAVGADGTVYVADPTHRRVVALGGAVFGQLARPVAVAVAADGAVYVADDESGRVHAFAPDGTPRASWPAGDPHGIAVAPDATLLVADKRSGQVLRFNARGAPLGEFGRSNVSGRLNVPRGVAADCRGRAYVVDNSNPRVHVFGEPGPPPPCLAPPAPPAPLAPPPPLQAAAVPEPEPVLGRTARATLVSGSVLVGSGIDLRPLRGREIVPVGSTVDATDGRVLLELASAPGADRQRFGRFMDAEFFDGAFTIAQRTTSSLVDLRLLDESGLTLRSLARASARKRKLRVWGKARGRFRTSGRNGAATVRGTEWLTSEQELGTLFRVKEGVVDVREFASGRVVRLRAGEEFLAKPACVSRRSFRIRLRVAPGARVRSAVVLVRGKRVAVRHGRRLTAPVDLRGAPAGKVRVLIRIRTADGRVVTGTRTYRTCRNTTRIPRNPPPV
jgi:hypothetical protein